MRILLLNTTAYPKIGGIENSLRYMAKDLKMLGHNVRILALRFNDEDPRRVELEGVEIVRLDCKRIRFPILRNKMHKKAIENSLNSVLKDFYPDEIWCRNFFMAAGVLASGYQGTIKQIFPTSAKLNTRGEFFNNKGMNLSKRLILLGLSGPAYYYFYKTERTLLEKTVPVVFSKNMQNQLLKDHGKFAENVTVVRPGVNTDFFSSKNGNDALNQIEQRFGVDRNQDYVLYVGRLSRTKNVPFLLDAYRKVSGRAKLILVGDGHDKKLISHHADKLGLSDRVIFAGSQYELLPGFYTMAKVSVLPTTIESFGQVLLESLACGTPVVGFGNTLEANTATGEIIEDGVTGKVVNQINSQAFADGIESILNLSADYYQKMSNCCRNYVSRNFRWDSFVRTVLSLPSEK